MTGFLPLQGQYSTAELSCHLEQPVGDTLACTICTFILNNLEVNLHVLSVFCPNSSVTLIIDTSLTVLCKSIVSGDWFH